jgi:uncharacterized protein (DUF58 family)
MNRSPVPFFSRFVSRKSCRRSIRLTPEGTRFLLFVAAVGIAAVNTGNNLFYLLLSMMLSLIVVSGLLSELSLRRLACRRRLPEYVFANEPVQLSLTVMNHKTCCPSFSLRLFGMMDEGTIDREYSIPYLAPRTSRRVVHTFRAARRGLHRLEDIRVATCFPFGFFRKTLSYPDAAAILVCPALVPLPLPMLQELGAMGQDHAFGRRGPGTALYNLREYRPGDDSRAIHWMTTARTSQLMLKETEADDQRIVTILLSPFAEADDEPAFERAVSIAASLITYFHDRCYAICAVIDDEPIGPGTGAEHYVEILRALALCTPREPGASPLPGQPAALPSAEAGVVIGVMAASAGQEGTSRLAWADCIISTDQSGEPVYVARTGVRP